MTCDLPTDELWNTLLRFHHEVFMEDLERILGHDDFGIRAFRDDMRAGFNEMHRRFDRLHAIHADIGAGLARIERRLAKLAGQD